MFAEYFTFSVGPQAAEPKNFRVEFSEPDMRPSINNAKKVFGYF